MEECTAYLSLRGASMGNCSAWQGTLHLLPGLPSGHGKLFMSRRSRRTVGGSCSAWEREGACAVGQLRAARAEPGAGVRGAQGAARGARGGGAGGAPEPTSCTPTRGAFSPRSRSVASSEPPPPASPPLRILTEAGVQRSGPWRLSPSPVVFSLSTTAIAVCIELDNLGIFLHGIHIIDVTKNQSIKGTKYMVAEGY